ncbi:MAG: glucokinase [Spirulinaceae cyanobacterium]
MTLLLVGDIGGTKTTLRLVQASGGKFGAILAEERYISAHFPDLVPIVQKFLIAAEKTSGETLIPQKACFAIAGPVVNDTCILTNLNWVLAARRLETELNLTSVRLINDFVAVGYGVLGLNAQDVYTRQNAPVQARSPIAIIGAGTGLGQGFLAPEGESYRVFASEGGHASFSPRSDREFRLLQYIRRKYNTHNVSVERVVSGQGIVAIYQFLRDEEFPPETTPVSEKVQAWEQGKDPDIDPAAIIAQGALEKRDRLSCETLDLFIDAYGAEAGNLALKLLPYGGLYIAGGIAPKVLPLLKTDRFINAFLDKGRLSGVLKQIPIQVILNPQVGLIGAAICAAR